MAVEVTEALAARQFGLISRDQALAANLTTEVIRYRLRVGRWLPHYRSIYRLPSHGPSWEQTAMLGCLLGGAGAGLSHQTAGWLHGLDGLQRPELIDVLTPKGRRLHHAAFDHHVSATPPLRMGRVRGLPVTTLGRTLIDLASVLTDEAFELALDSAYRQRQGVGRWVRALLAKREDSPRGVRRLLGLLDQRLGKTESSLERRVRRRLCAAQVVEWREQVDLSDAAGFITRADFGWPAHRVALFADSWRWHGGRRQLDKDASQRNRLHLAGWEFLVVTSVMLKTTLWLDQLRGLLERRAPQRVLFAPS